MTPSLGQALSGIVSAAAHSKPSAADAKSKDDSFGDMVKGTEKQPGRHAQRQAALQTTPPSARAARDSAQTKLADDEPDAAASSGPTAGKAEKEHREPGQLDAGVGGDATGVAANMPSLQDRLPLLVALHEMRQFSTSPGAATDEVAAETSVPAGTHEPRIPELLAAGDKAQSVLAEDAAAGAVARFSRATTATAYSAIERSQALTAGTGFDEPVQRGDRSPAQQQDRDAVDIAELTSKRPAPETKEPETIKLSTSSAQVKQASSAGRIDVVAQQSFPVPAQNPMSQTASALIEAIASDEGVQQAFSSAPTRSQPTSSVAVPTHVLKIELHPAELGAVTASLRLSGEQLSIEMKPETHEAHRRLTADSDAIVKSMRSLGFDVDTVTILQPSIAAHAAGRADATSASPLSGGRDQPSFQPGNSGGNSAGGDRQPGRNDGHGAQEFGRAASPLRERAGDDMYI
ncbi:MAG: flagellar hook-length control protein FliK [Mesorhizobium sp.]|uniref:flagellar hook-length control protein FliK n=2 Tax=unclassified Mesorhizobium TaxID=325217 RepID=UPI000FE9F354|nr:flagellar hook-length control protein FliK [Mesorhizobium sp.]RWB87063.1 MAG: flagellar hook-length control protein FliK [Mesorhizobium sp.]